MKKIIFAMMAAGVFTLSSCSGDDLSGPGAQDGNVIITARIPGVMHGRYGEGDVAKTLHYAVYEGNDVVFASDKPGSPAPQTVDAKNFRLALNLVKGKTYDFVFWADASEGSPYEFSSSSKSVKVNYDNVGNNENRDAFFQAVKDMTVDGALTKAVELRRPFAQINVGTNDFDLAEAANTEVATTTLTIKGAYNSLNLLSGEASGSADVSYTAAVPENQTFPIDNYEYLSMDYILTGSVLPDADDVQNADRELIDIAYTVTCTDGHEIDYSFSNVPVQRNYRTNIYGSLLTNPADFDIVVLPGFNDDPGFEVEVVEEGKVKMGNETYNTIDAAIAAANAAGQTEVSLVLGNGDYSQASLRAASNAFTALTVTGQGPATVINKAGSITLAGVNVTFNNLTIKTDNTKYNGFQHNVSETYSGCVIEKKLFLYGPAKFENCTFKNDGDYSVWTYGSTNASFKNCSFGSYGKSVLIYSEDANLRTEVTFDNCTFSGTSLNDSKAAIEVDCSLATNGLYTVNINNCVATGYDAGLLSGNNLWNVKKGTNFVLNLDGEKVQQGLTTDGKNDYFVNNADGLVSLSRLVNGYYKDGSIAHERMLGNTVTLTADIDMAGVSFTPIGAGITYYPIQNFAGTFDGANHTISNLTVSDNRPDWAAAGLFGGLVGNVRDLTLRNVSISSTHYAGGIAGYVDNETGSVIDNCKVIGGTITSTTEELSAGNWDNGDKAGGILGYGCVNADKVTNCTVQDLTIKAYRHFGSIVGHAGNTANVTGNTAKNITLVWDKAHDYKGFGTLSNVPYGDIVGNDKTFTGSNTAENITQPTE